MNWQEFKIKLEEKEKAWEIIKNDLSRYDFLKKSYLVVTLESGGFGQAELNELRYSLNLSKYVDLIQQEDVKKEISIMAEKIEQLERQKFRQKNGNSNYWLEKRIEFIQKQIIKIIDKAELVETQVEIRFNKLDFKGIAELKKHPLVNKDSYGIRIILKHEILHLS